MMRKNTESSIGDFDRHLTTGVLIEIFVGIVPIPRRVVRCVHAPYRHEKVAGDSKPVGNSPKRCFFHVMKEGAGMPAGCQLISCTRYPGQKKSKGA